MLASATVLGPLDVQVPGSILYFSFDKAVFWTPPSGRGGPVELLLSLFL